MSVLMFKKLHPDATLPTRNNDSDAGLDIYAVEDVTIPASEVDSRVVGVNVGRARIQSGLAVDIPWGSYGKIVGRSGMAFIKDIICFEGTIDSSYRGGIDVLLYNMTSRPYYIRKGDRIAQLIVQRCDLSKPTWVNELSHGARGEDGFGKSGR